MPLFDFTHVETHISMRKDTDPDPMVCQHPAGHFPTDPEEDDLHSTQCIQPTISGRAKSR